MPKGILEIEGRGRIELTEEQIAKLLGEEKKNPFERYGYYYYIGNDGIVYTDFESEDINCRVTEHRYDAANYCKDKELMEQRSLHETLNRLLWRFSMENDGDKIDWGNRKEYKYRICYSYDRKRCEIADSLQAKGSMNYFYSYKIAERAIKEIVEPFMKEHPEFVW